MFALIAKSKIAFTELGIFILVCAISFFCFTLWSTPPGNNQPKASTKSIENASRKWQALSADSDNDGFPNSAELASFGDRENFRRWFTALAETQFYEMSAEWNADQRDCAGLVRFAWRESLRRHDRKWLHKMGQGYEIVGPDVVAYDLEGGPLGEKLFRTDFGTYQQTDLAAGKFSEFADARTLKDFNTVFIGRDRERAQPGDLLFFHQPWVQEFPYHVMIFLGHARIAHQQPADWVVYHTGASTTDAGEVKKVQLSVLDQHPNKRWRPVEANPNFLGYYRLKILR